MQDSYFYFSNYFIIFCFNIILGPKTVAIDNNVLEWRKRKKKRMKEKGLIAK